MGIVDRDTRLLCESCGYDLAGLGDGSRCGECGRAVVDSWPERRPGTAWQGGASVWGWVRTGRAVLGRPRTVWDRARVERRSGESLALVNAMVAAALPAAAMVINQREDLWNDLSGVRVSVVAGWIVAWMGMAVAALALTWIEARGIRFFGARNGWRVGRAVAGTVCGHASYGWVVAGALVGVLWLIVDRVPVVEPLARAMHWGLVQIPGVGGSGAGGRGNPVTGLIEAAYVTILGGGFVAGMLVFETLVFIGVRRLRYANPSSGG